MTNEIGATVTFGTVTTTEEPSCNIINDGTFTVPVKGTLDVIGGGEAGTTFTQSDGTLANNGTIRFTSADFAASGGTESGHPVQLDRRLRAHRQCWIGLVHPPRPVHSERHHPSRADGHRSWHEHRRPGSRYLSTDVTNDGTLVLDSTSSFYTAEIANESNFNFTNNGTFHAHGTNGGTDIINTPFSNAGTVTINTLTEGKAYQTISNSGTFTIAPNMEFETSGGSGAATDFNNVGTLDNKGTFTLDDTTLNPHGSGTYEARFGAPNDTPSTLSGPSVAGESGTVNVGGTLEIGTVGTPAVGTAFDVVGSSTSTTVTSGTFSSYELAARATR